MTTQLQLQDLVTADRVTILAQLFWCSRFNTLWLSHCSRIVHRERCTCLSSPCLKQNKTKQLGKHKARALASARCHSSLIIRWFRWSLFLELLLLCLVSSNTAHCDLANSYVNSGIPLGWNARARPGVTDTHKKEVYNIYVHVHMRARASLCEDVPGDHMSPWTLQQVTRLVNSGRSRV